MEATYFDMPENLISPEDYWRVYYPRDIQLLTTIPGRHAKRQRCKECLYYYYFTFFYLVHRERDFINLKNPILYAYLEYWHTPNT